MDRSEESRLIAATEIKVRNVDLTKLLHVDEGLTLIVPGAITVPRQNGETKTIPSVYATWFVLKGIIGVHKDRVYAENAWKLNYGDNPATRLSGIITVSSDHFTGTIYHGQQALAKLVERYI